MSATRQYDLLVFGATGYTGRLTAEYITVNLPTDLQWALAGRSRSKLEAVAAECKALNPDRIQPGIEICNLDFDGLSALAKKTSLFLTTVGPYILHGEQPFRACAENGTHYLDATGEVAWVARMIKKYEKTAKASGSVMVPQCGIDSAPADLVTWSIADMTRERFSSPTAEVIVSVHDISSRPSGGTVDSLCKIMDVCSLKELSEAGADFALSPIPGPHTPNPTTWITKVFGIRTVPDLGLVTTFLGAVADRPLVQRSWGLLGGASGYGPNFRFSQYMKTRNYLTGILLHFGIVLGSLLFVIPLFRTLMQKTMYQPGEGASKEESKNDRIEYRGIGYPDMQPPTKSRAFCRAYFEGPLYEFTGVLLAEAAMTILRDDHKLTGGIYTPACLGQNFIDRLQSGEFKFEKKWYDN